MFGYICRLRFRKINYRKVTKIFKKVLQFKMGCVMIGTELRGRQERPPNKLTS
jgi:hypothetical protein